MKFTWFLFAGHDPTADAVAVAAEYIHGLAADMGGGNVDPGESLRALQERPLAVVVPWSMTTTALDQRLVGNMGVCLAASFSSATADLVAERGRTAWEACQQWVRRHNLDGSDN